MNRISLVLFLIIECTAYSAHSKPKPSDQEMTVFYDPQIHEKKVDTYSLDKPYNLHLLRKIIFHTEQHGMPSERTFPLFEQFMKIGYNYIALDPLVEKQVKIYVENPDTASKIAKTLNQQIQLACLARSEETCRKELQETQKQRKQLEDSMGITSIHT